MAAVYYEKIDVEGHHFGPDSDQVRTAVQQLDLAMQTLNNKIKVSHTTDVIITISSTTAILFPSCSLVSGACEILAGEEHGEPAEHYAIFRPWYDKDQVDGEGHRAGKVYQHV